MFDFDGFEIDFGQEVADLASQRDFGSGFDFGASSAGAIRDRQEIRQRMEWVDSGFDSGICFEVGLEVAASFLRTT